MSSQVVKTVAVVVALIALGIGGWVWYDRSQNAYLSETITRSAPELGPGAHLLLPDLESAEVTVIDRPHDPSEAMAEDRFEKITRLRVFHVSTNSIGLRGPELDTPKERFRVICAGDSVTFGWGVSYEESYPARLQRALTKADRAVEVVNAGVPAMKPSTLANWVTSQAAQWEADLILVARRPDYNAPNPLEDLKDNLRLIKSLTNLPVALVLPPVSTFDVKGNQNQADELAWLKSNLTIPLIDLTETFREEAAELPGVWLDIGNDGTQRMLQHPGRNVIVEADAADTLAPEIIEQFESDPNLKEPLFFDGGHPTSKGFVIFADEVFRFLVSNELIPG
jgi:lysophospholipase L1-like esterase